MKLDDGTLPFLDGIKELNSDPLRYQAQVALTELHDSAGLSIKHLLADTAVISVIGFVYELSRLRVSIRGNVHFPFRDEIITSCDLLSETPFTPQQTTANRVIL
jgi:hypothetical protein